MPKLLLIVPALALSLAVSLSGHAAAAGNAQNPCIGAFASSLAGPGYGQFFVAPNAQAGIVGPFASSFATTCNPAR